MNVSNIINSKKLYNLYDQIFDYFNLAIYDLESKIDTSFDYKNIKLLKRYVSENGKILPSRITSVSQKKQRELSLSIKRARNLALL